MGTKIKIQLGNFFTKKLHEYCTDFKIFYFEFQTNLGARCSSVVRAFTHGAMGHRIDHSWGEPIELFLVPASAP